MFKNGNKVKVVPCNCFDSPNCGHNEEDKEYLDCVGKVTSSGYYVFNVEFENRASRKFYITQLNMIEQ